MVVRRDQAQIEREFYEGVPPLTSTMQTLTPTAVTQLTVPDGAYKAIISVESQNIRVTFDGTTPVANTTGHEIAAGSMLTFENHLLLEALKILEEASGATVVVSYFGSGS